VALLIGRSHRQGRHDTQPLYYITAAEPDSGESAIVSGVFMMSVKERLPVCGDRAINPDPDAGQLADIAIQAQGDGDKA
jgi:phosphate acetyltransferase